MKIEQQAQTRAFLIQSFSSVRVGTHTALRSGLLCGFHFFKKQSTENRWSYVSNSKERAEWKSDTAS